MNTRTAAILIAVVLLAAGAGVLMVKNNSSNSSSMTELEKADALIADITKKRGLQPEDVDGSQKLQRLELSYLPERQAVQAAIVVRYDPQWNKINETFTQNYLKSTKALSDPAIGGMFDTGGGLWRFNESSGKTYLYREFSVDSSVKDVQAGIAQMEEVVPQWEVTWLRAVAGIVHENEPAPTKPVTLEDNPYHDI